jgi:hypothetical protein
VQKLRQTWIIRLFWICLGLTILVYVLRGFAVLAMIPGGVIWALILLSLGTGILAALQTMRRRY